MLGTLVRMLKVPFVPIIAECAGSLGSQVRVFAYEDNPWMSLDSSLVQVTVQDVNEPPVLTLMEGEVIFNSNLMTILQIMEGSENGSFVESRTRPVQNIKISAVDPEGKALTFSVIPRRCNAFTINEDVL